MIRVESTKFRLLELKQQWGRDLPDLNPFGDGGLLVGEFYDINAGGSIQVDINGRAFRLGMINQFPKDIVNFNIEIPLLQIRS